MYPPGQFAAWNRGHGAGTGRSAPPAAGRDPAATEDPASSGSQPAAQRAAGSGLGPRRRLAASRTGPTAEPGYSMLAVSDPAADVTSTQTWQAVGDGRATGVWTAPARAGAGPSRRAAQPAGAPDPARSAPGTGRPGGPLPLRPGPGQRPYRRTRRRAGRAGGRTRRGQPAARASRARDLTATAELAAGPRSASAPAAGGPGRRPAQPGRRPRRAARAPIRRRAGRGPDAHRGSRGRSDGSDARGQVPQPGRKSAAAAERQAGHRSALVLVLAAAAALAYGVLRSSAQAEASRGAAASSPTSASAAPSPTLGPYGHIGTRSADPKPLTSLSCSRSASRAAGGHALPRQARAAAAPAQ